MNYLFTGKIPPHKGWQGMVSFSKKYETMLEKINYRQALSNFFFQACQENNINSKLKKFILKEYKNMPLDEIRKLITYTEMENEIEKALKMSSEKRNEGQLDLFDL